VYGDEKVKVFKTILPVRVETSKVSEDARADPVGTEDVPKVPECAYSLAIALPVGEPTFNNSN